MAAAFYPSARIFSWQFQDEAFQRDPTDQNLIYTNKQDSLVSWLAQTGFAAFGKVAQLVNSLICLA